MLPPIRITPTKQNQELSQRLATELENILQLILMGNSITLAPFEAFSMPIATYLRVYKKKSVIVNIDIENKPNDKIYMFFEFNSAIVLGSYLRQQSESVIKSKIESQEFLNITADAFDEISNQFTGALDRSIRHLSSTNLHLVMNFEKNLFPDDKISEEFFISKKEYIVWLSTLTLEPYTKEKLTILIPQPIFENVVGQRITYVDLIPEHVALYSPSSNFAKMVKGKIESRYCEVDIIASLEDIIRSAEQMKHSILAIDFGVVAMPLPPRIDIFFQHFIKTGAQNSKRTWIYIQGADLNPRTALTAIGLTEMAGVTIADSREDLAPWLQMQIKKLYD